MRRRPFGPLNRDVPVIGQGTWQMLERGPRAAMAVAALRRGIGLGLTHVDTAEMYGDGRAETLVGEAIAGIPRDQLFIVSKVLPSHADRRGTHKACDASLRRLNLEYLDAYLLHWPSNFPIAETMGALEELVDAGKIRALGVSNFDVGELEAARAALRRHPLVCNQVLYHLRERSIERDVLPYCVRHRIAVVGYSPFGHGDFPSGHTREGRMLERVGKDRGATARQVALAFLTRIDGTFTIPKASDEAHVRDNAAAAQLQLSPADIAAIDAAFPVSASGGLPVL